MPVFKRKLKIEKEEDRGEEPRKKKIRKSDYRTRKRKKEPPKPWGKKERLLILFILLATAGTSSFLALSSRSFKLPGFPQIKKPGISFFGEETIVIEGNKRQQEKAQEIINFFQEETKNLSGVYGLYVLDLTTNYSYGVNEKDIFEPASLNKLPVMLAMYSEEEKGNIDLAAKYQLKKSDKVSGAGSLSGEPIGFEVTYQDLISLMGNQSDNTAANIAKNLLGEDVIARVINDLGMVDTDFFGEDQQTTPLDIGIFFQKLWLGNLISETNEERLLSALTDTIYEEWLVSGAPGRIRVAHKFGREVHVVNDAGIIYFEKPLVVVVMSKGAVEREADEVIPHISGKIYEVYLR